MISCMSFIDSVFNEQLTSEESLMMQADAKYWYVIEQFYDVISIIFRLNNFAKPLTGHRKYLIFLH